MLYPMFALLLLTLGVAIYLLTLRTLAVRRREVSMSYFRLYHSAEPPPAKLIAASRHYDNLFQVPVLFYLACITALVLGVQGPLALAWGFVALRLIHTLIHLSYNNVLHRFLAFMASNLLLIAIWVTLAMQYSARGGL